MGLCVETMFEWDERVITREEEQDINQAGITPDSHKDDGKDVRSRRGGTNWILKEGK